MVKLDIVGPHAPQAGQDLCEGCDDQVFAVSGTSRNTLLSLPTRIIMTSLSGDTFSLTEFGVSITAASCGRKEVVSMKKVSKRANKSTIGVMSIWGVFTGSLIFGMVSYFVVCKPGAVRHVAFDTQSNLIWIVQQKSV